jgi:hypothetical protein
MVDLEWLLDYELRSAVRYRRFVSVILVAYGDGNGRRNPRGLIGDNLLRASDEFFELNGDCAIVMGETDRIGALAAIERLKRLCNGESDLRFAVISFPLDGHIARELLSTAHRRLDKARALGSGAVVATG